MVRAHVAAGLYDKALRKISDYLQKIEIFGVRGLGYCDLLKQKGDVYVKLNQIPEAIRSYERSYNEARSIGNVPVEVIYTQ